MTQVSTFSELSRVRCGSTSEMCGCEIMTRGGSKVLESIVYSYIFHDLRQSGWSRLLPRADSQRGTVGLLLSAPPKSTAGVIVICSQFHQDSRFRSY